MTIIHKTYNTPVKTRVKIILSQDFKLKKDKTPKEIIPKSMMGIRRLNGESIRLPKKD